MARHSATRVGPVDDGVRSVAGRYDGWPSGTRRTAGLVPLDAGVLHSLRALFAFPFFEMRALGVASRVRGVMRHASVVAGGHGGAERTIVSPVTVRLVAFGGDSLGRTDSASAARIDSGPRPAHPSGTDSPTLLDAAADRAL